MASLAAAVRTHTPNVAGVAIKTSNGKDWQGHHDDTKAAMAVVGPGSIAQWVTALSAHGLEAHAWCVVHGRDIEVEARRVLEACHVPGLRSMILDVEAGERYFGGQPADVARAFICRVRAELPGTFHLGLCLFVRGDEPEKIHLEEWLPYVNSLHPMIYHWDFSSGSSGPRPYLDEAFSRLAPYGLPLVPILQTYPDPESGKPVPEAHIVEAGDYAFQKGAAGISFFRLGAAGPPEFAAIRRITARPAHDIP